MPVARPRGRASRRLVLASTLVAVAGAAIPAAAQAATQYPVKLDGISVSTALPGNGSFGLYTFALQKASDGAQPMSWVSPFTQATNNKATFFGHCVELDQGAGQASARLRSGDDLSFDNGTKNTIPAGDDDVRVAQLKWLLTSSYQHRADADYANGIAAGAHQSAVWKIVNPGNAGNDIGTATTDRAKADAMADALLTAAQANAGAFATSTWSLKLLGGSGATCAGSTRTLEVKGSPNTIARLKITAGSAKFANGATEVDVPLGDDGVEQVNLIDVGADADSVAVQATLPDWVLAQADNGGNQDFAFLLPGTAVVKSVTVAFAPCKDLVVAKSAAGSFTRTYDWNVEKTAGAVTLRQREGTATIPYTITATRGAPVDTGFALAGSISVTNPNTAAVTASVVDTLPGATCQVASSVTVPAGTTVQVPYACTFASRPAGAVVNHVELSWPRAGLLDGTAADDAPPVTYATPSTVVHGSVQVLDAFNGGQAASLGNCAQATCTYPLTKTVDLPSTPTCNEVSNTALVRDGSSTLDTSTVGSSVCRTAENLVVTKTVDPAFARSYDWTLAKDVDRTSVVTDDATATFTYTVQVSKGPAVDGDYRVTGTISVVNSNTYAIAGATITDEVSNGGTCVVANGSGRTIPARGTLDVDYTCTWAGAPTAPNGANRATISYLPYGCAVAGTGACAPISATMEPQPFSFAAPTSVSRDAVDVTDTFDGTPGALAAGLAESKTFTYVRTVPLSALAAGACLEKANVARVTATDDAGYVRTADRTVKVCRPEAPTPPDTPDTPSTPETPSTPSGVTVTPATGGGTGSTRTGVSTTTVALTKVAAKATVVAGREVTFTIKLRNTGKSNLLNVRVCDLLPGTMTYVSAPGATFSKGKACWSRTTLRPGKQLTFKITARIDLGAGVGSTCNTAAMTAGNAAKKNAKACIGTRPRRAAVSGGTVGVTG